MKLAFITGITGQDGSYLAELLLEKGYKVYGIKRRTSQFSTSRIDHIRNKINLRYGDLSDGSSLHNYINSIIEDNKDFEVLEIYNLAAQSHVGISFEVPEYTADIDAHGPLRLLEIIRSSPYKNKIRFYQASTSEMFGRVKETPQSEDTPFNPVSPYAAAKLYSHYIVRTYREGYGIFAVSGILFNHESNRRGENFLTRKVVLGVQDIVAGKKSLITLGNLEAKRDWGWAPDYVYGMWLMMQNEIPKDYVLATGKCYTVREFVEKSFKKAGYTIFWNGDYGFDENGILRVTTDGEYYRPCEVDLLLGDPSRAEKEIGWTRRCRDIDDLIDKMW